MKIASLLQPSLVFSLVLGACGSPQNEPKVKVLTPESDMFRVVIFEGEMRINSLKEGLTFNDAANFLAENGIYDGSMLENRIGCAVGLARNERNQFWGPETHQDSVIPLGGWVINNVPECGRGGKEIK